MSVDPTCPHRNLSYDLRPDDVRIDGRSTFRPLPSVKWRCRDCGSILTREQVERIRAREGWYGERIKPLRVDEMEQMTIYLRMGYEPHELVRISGRCKDQILPRSALQLGGRGPNGTGS